VLALRYGTCLTTRAQCFLDYERYGEPDAPQQMDFFLWVVRDSERTVVIDTGFDWSVATRRERQCLVAPTRALVLAGVEPATVEHVVLTHLHYDHVGNIDAFPRATFHAHERELEFWRGSHARLSGAAALVEPGELDAVYAAARAGRVRPIRGDCEIAPGVFALLAGGHTPGQLIVAVRAARSIVVVASDALHFYEELDRDRPFALLSDVQASYAAYDLLRDLRAQGAQIVAGHDPVVFDRFPRLGGPAEEIAVRAG
jgi:glyoxylase-like metal-dependent hydrolase (beta-lactamase superfamily II)